LLFSFLVYGISGLKFIPGPPIKDPRIQDELQPTGRVSDPFSLFTDQDPALNNKHGSGSRALYSSELKKNVIFLFFLCLIFVSFSTKISTLSSLLLIKKENKEHFEGLLMRFFQN
jgi:hypothetical protein